MELETSGGNFSFLVIFSWSEANSTAYYLLTTSLLLSSCSLIQYLIGKKFSHIISNVNMYKRCKSYPMPLLILKARWKLFGHALRPDRKKPTKTAIDNYFEETGSKG